MTTRPVFDAPEPAYEAVLARRYTARQEAVHADNGNAQIARDARDVLGEIGAELATIQGFDVSAWDPVAIAAWERSDGPPSAGVAWLLGPRPENPADATLWRYTATRLLIYAQQWGTEPGVLHGPVANADQLRDRARVLAVVGDAVRTLDDHAVQTRILHAPGLQR